MRKLGKRNGGAPQSLVVARGCYCFDICSCGSSPSIKAVYQVSDILGNMSFETM